MDQTFFMIPSRIFLRILLLLCSFLSAFELLREDSLEPEYYQYLFK